MFAAYNWKQVAESKRAQRESAVKHGLELVGAGTADDEQFVHASGERL